MRAMGRSRTYSLLDGLGTISPLHVSGQTGTDFALNKNSRFKECAASPSKSTNCIVVMTANLGFEKSGEEQDDHHYLNSHTKQSLITEVEKASAYDWCDLVSYLSDLKVIPSSPSQNALGYQALSDSIGLSVTVVS